MGAEFGDSAQNQGCKPPEMLYFVQIYLATTCNEHATFHPTAFTYWKHAVNDAQIMQEEIMSQSTVCVQT
jgi:hypothetical protein